MNTTFCFIFFLKMNDRKIEKQRKINDQVFPNLNEL